MASSEANFSRARLIPITGIGSQKEAETRAASAVLAVLSVVRDLSSALFSPLGAPRAVRAIVETFTETPFTHGGKRVRPDGLVRITYGKANWTALIEVKTGDAVLDPDQINMYWEIAREHGFDSVVTISNEIAPAPGVHPTEGLRVRSNSKVTVNHISWTALLSAAVMCKVHRGVEDPEQAWLVGELIRYLEHPSSGAMAFEDMGTNWVGVRDGARDGALRKNDEAVQDIAQRWDQLLRYTALQLGARIGDDVQQVLSRTHHDQKARASYLVERLCSGAPLDGTLRVPNTAGDMEIEADLKARRVYASVSVIAPEDRGGKARCSWMLSQIRDAPPDLLVEAYPKNARTPNAAKLAEAQEDRDVLLGADRRDPHRFRLVLTREMGASRKSGGRSPGFIDSIVELVESFYGSVVQDISPWTPRAPRISAPKAVAGESDHSPAAPEDIDPPAPEPESPVPETAEPPPTEPADLVRTPHPSAPPSPDTAPSSSLPTPLREPSDPPASPPNPWQP